MKQIRIDLPRKQYSTTNGVLVRYKSSLGYRKTLEYYASKIREGWQFESSWIPQPRARELNLDSLDERIARLSKTREVYVGDIVFAPDGSIRDDGRVIFTRARIIELAGRN